MSKYHQHVISSDMCHVLTCHISYAPSPPSDEIVSNDLWSFSKWHSFNPCYIELSRLTRVKVSPHAPHVCPISVVQWKRYQRSLIVVRTFLSHVVRPILTSGYSSSSAASPASVCSEVTSFITSGATLVTSFLHFKYIYIYVILILYVKMCLYILMGSNNGCI